MVRTALSVGALVGLFACDPGEELRETGAMEGAWAGRWAASGRFIRTPQRSTPIELEFESSELVRGIVHDQSFDLASRRELFDGR